jgi:hypothetical protein
VCGTRPWHIVVGTKNIVMFTSFSRHSSGNVPGVEWAVKDRNTGHFHESSDDPPGFLEVLVTVATISTCLAMLRPIFAFWFSAESARLRAILTSDRFVYCQTVQASVATVVMEIDLQNELSVEKRMIKCTTR